MKKSLHSLFVAAIVSVTVVCGHAAEAVSEAVVLKVKGAAKATLPGQSAPTGIQAGDKLPQGTKIETPANSEVQIQAFSGSTTTIRPNTKVDLSKLSLTTANGQVTKQTAQLDLKVGSVASTLDPTKRAINDYSVRTPKGVAAARGTEYVVVVTPSGDVRTFVTTGVVVFVNPATNQSVTVQPGYAVTVGADGTISTPVIATEAQLGATGDAPNSPEQLFIEVIDPTIPVVSPSS